MNDPRPRLLVALRKVKDAASTTARTVGPLLSEMLSEMMTEAKAVAADEVLNAVSPRASLRYALPCVYCDGQINLDTGSDSNSGPLDDYFWNVFGWDQEDDERHGPPHGAVQCEECEQLFGWQYHGRGSIVLTPFVDEADELLPIAPELLYRPSGQWRLD